MPPIVLAKTRNPSRMLSFSFALLLFCAASAHSQSPRSPARDSAPQADLAPSTAQSAIVARTELVVLPVSVTSTKGDFVPGLNVHNFRVYDDGRLQTVAAFQDGDTPVTVGLIVDHSRSMGPKLAEVAAAVYAFAQSSNPQDQAFVVDFNDSVSVELLDGEPFTHSPSELEKAVSAVSARGRTSLYDAIAEGLIHLQLGDWDKKALIIVSDGGDNASRYKYSQILALAHRSQVVVYSIGLTDPNDEDADENPGLLRRLSKETGGIAFFPTSSRSVMDISKEIARDLREEYTLGFVPAKTGAAGSFRHIRVTVDAAGRGKLHVRTRPGYYLSDHQDPAVSGRPTS